ncbi:hypothetical protein K9L67_04355 [Candidatus Woesearchaeota archaeon]|nr:hypothetical protein [Candidatus Woesearchaeota archaeon]
MVANLSIMRNEDVIKELENIKKRVSILEKEMLDEKMTPEEENLYEEVLKEVKEGKTTSLEDLRQELQNAKN